MTTIELRLLALADLAEIEEIERRSYPTPWSRSMFAGELAKPSSICLGAFEADSEDGALGVGERVTSPTYTIGHRYHGDGVEVSHLDLYRFRDVSAAQGLSPAEWGDLEPYFEDAIAFVESPEAGEGVLPPPRFAVRLRHAGAGRAVEIEEC